jgi:predicted amidophosphoribosyltransferase
MAQIDNIKHQLEKPMTHLVKYFPIRIRNVNEQQKADRQLIYDFKDGRAYEQVAVMTANRLKEQYGEQLANMVFICIPASSKEKNELRYKDFSCRVSELTGMQNGYEHVYVESNRLALHEQDRKKRVRTAQVIDFDKDFFDGKNILVYDDVVTTGESYGLFANQLEQFGGKVLGGLFLGRTSYNVNK